MRAALEILGGWFALSCFCALVWWRLSKIVDAADPADIPVDLPMHKDFDQ